MNQQTHLQKQLQKKQNINTQLSPSEIQQGNKVFSVSKWTRRCENTKQTKYKNIVPSISHKKLKLRAIVLKNTCRKEISKIATLKTELAMLKGHRNKTDTETFPECSTCKVKETSEHFLLNCKEYDTQNEQNQKRI